MRLCLLTSGLEQDKQPVAHEEQDQGVLHREKYVHVAVDIVSDEEQEAQSQEGPILCQTDNQPASVTCAINPNKLEAFNQCWINVGPASQTVDQHWPSIGCMYRVYSPHATHA